MSKEKIKKSNEIIEKLHSYIDSEKNLMEEEEEAFKELIADFKNHLEESFLTRGNDESIKEAAESWAVDEEDDRKKKILDFLEEQIDTIHPQKNGK